MVEPDFPPRLYRGVNKRLDEKNGGRLLPYGDKTNVVPKADGKWKADGRFKAGRCMTNTARAHHIEPGLYGGAGVSSSRSLEVAIRFATYDYTEEGYVYVIDEGLLSELGVYAQEFQDPLVPGEREVTLIEKSGEALPAELIIEKRYVSANGATE